MKRRQVVLKSTRDCNVIRISLSGVKHDILFATFYSFNSSNCMKSEPLNICWAKKTYINNRNAITKKQQLPNQFTPFVGVIKQGLVHFFSFDCWKADCVLETVVINGVWKKCIALSAGWCLLKLKCNRTYLTRRHLAAPPIIVYHFHFRLYWNWSDVERAVN